MHVVKEAKVPPPITSLSATLRSRENFSGAKSKKKSIGPCYHPRDILVAEWLILTAKSIYIYTIIIEPLLKQLSAIISMESINNDVGGYGKTN